MKHSQRGYSLVELSIVLAIVAVVIAGAIAGVQSILRANNVVNTISDTNRSVNKIVSKLVRDSSYANATMVVMTTNGMDVWDTKQLGANPGTVNAVVTNAFGGRVYVAPLGADAMGLTANQAFVYSLSGIPAAACSDVVLGLEGLGVGVSVTNQLATAVAAPPTALGPNLVKQPNVPVAANLVANACNANTGQTTISLLVPRS
jgi:prepilin-type N-terminal cleavage/methylation domain-containing protein